MVDDTLRELLSGNDEHVNALPDGYFDRVRIEQHPSVVSICCSDSRVSQERMWGVDRPGEVFTPSNIGNHVWDVHEGERIVDGNLLYPIHYTGTETAVVVGHTGCGAVTAAYQVATDPESETPGPIGVSTLVERLVPVVEEGLESDLVDADEEARRINQLVEYNVNAQVEFLREAEEVPDDVTVYGFVYDFQGVYGDDDGRTYLVNVDGETSPDAIAEHVPDEYEDAVRSLLH